MELQTDLKEFRFVINEYQFADIVKDGAEVGRVNGVPVKVIFSPSCSVDCQ
jgi:hypothetical protein